MIPTPLPASVCSKVCALYANVQEMHTYSTCTRFPVCVRVHSHLLRSSFDRVLLLEHKQAVPSNWSITLTHFYCLWRCVSALMQVQFLDSHIFSLTALFFPPPFFFLFFFLLIELFSISEKMNMSVNGNGYATTAIISEISNVLLRPRTSSHHHIIT